MKPGKQTRLANDSSEPFKSGQSNPGKTALDNRNSCPRPQQGGSSPSQGCNRSDGRRNND
jgi:hypothetical protein